jgi:hydroxymethylpyrimidine pyrophosphatase-like HAD family hydrolase
MTETDQSLKKAAYVDRDGTLAASANSPIPFQVKEALEAYSYRAIVTTKGELRIRQDGFSLTDLIVEAGSTRVLPSGEVLFEPLTLDEKNEIGQAIIKYGPELKLAAFYPKDNPRRDKRAILYTNSQKRAEEYRSALGQVIREVTLDPGYFAYQLRTLNTGMVEFTLDDERMPSAEKLLPADINYSIADFNFLVTTQGVTKGSATIKALESENIDPKITVTAGDQPVDIPMLKIPGITSIAVSNPSLCARFHVNSPEELAVLLDKLRLGTHSSY